MATCVSGPDEHRGILPQYPLERFRISDRMQLLVNTADGNLTITDRVLTIKGTGQNLSVDQFYNNQNTSQRAFGHGWQLGSGQDVWLDASFDDMVILHGPSGYCAEFDQNSDGSYTEAPGLHASLTRTSTGKYLVSFDQSNDTWTISPAGWLLSQADRNGNANSYRYNTDGTLASVTDSQGRVTTFHYTNGLVSRIVGPTGMTAGSYTYNDAAQLRSVTDRSGHTMHLSWGPGGNLTAITDPNGSSYRFGYDSQDRVTSVAVPRQGGAATTTFGYGDQQTTETDPNSHSVTYKYDDHGRQIRATDALGHTQSTTWTAHSDVQTTTNGLNNSTTRSYDGLDNLISTKLPTGAETTVGYASTAHPHLPTKVTDPQGNKVSRDYDAAGNVTVIHSDGLDQDLQRITYNQPHGTVDTVTDGNGHVASYDYDAQGNLVTVAPPQPMGATHYGYDSLSRVTSVTDGRGVRIDYAYDKLDRVVAITKHSDGTVLEALSYDANGDRVRLETPRETHTYTYQPGGLLTSDTRRDSATTETISYGYDPAGNLTSLTDPAGTTRYSYDQANRLTSLADPFGQTTSFGYDAADNRTHITWPGAGTETIGYDESNRQTSLTVTDTGGTQVLQRSYSYTTDAGADSNLMQSRTDDTGTIAYTYDSLERLTKAGGRTYSYDTAGNLTSYEGGTRVYNAADELVNDGLDRGYDGAGNLVHTASDPPQDSTYSATNQYVSGTDHAGDSFTATYDTTDQTQARSLSLTRAGTTTTHVFTRTALGITEDVTNGNRASYTRDPDGTLITEHAADGTRYDLITNYQGSVIGLLRADGSMQQTYHYTPYGGTSSNGAPGDATHFHYLGKWQFHAGPNANQLLGYRYYYAGWGRFTTTDPAHQETNPYAYAHNDPINNTDPTGTSYGSACALGAVQGIAYGAATGATETGVGIPVEAALGCLYGVGIAIVSNKISQQLGNALSLGSALSSVAGAFGFL